MLNTFFDDFEKYFCSPEGTLCPPGERAKGISPLCGTACPRSSAERGRVRGATAKFWLTRIFHFICHSGNQSAGIQCLFRQGTSRRLATRPWPFRKSTRPGTGQRPTWPVTTVDYGGNETPDRVRDLGHRDDRLFNRRRSVLPPCR